MRPLGSKAGAKGALDVLASPCVGLSFLINNTGFFSNLHEPSLARMSRFYLGLNGAQERIGISF